MIPADDDSSFKDWREHLIWFRDHGYLITEDGDEDATEGRVAAEYERSDHDP